MAIVELPDSLRAELSTPAGPLYTDATALLDAAGDPLVTVGDVVTDHVLGAGRTPAVAVVDGRTKRAPVDDERTERLRAAPFDHRLAAENPPGTLTAELLHAVREALDGEESTLIAVDGEEDLATLPAVVCAPPGASVAYGQPGEGMVLLAVTEASQARMRDLLSRMDGDTEQLVSILRR